MNYALFKKSVSGILDILTEKNAKKNTFAV